jgi:hypothetical protein
VDDPPVAVSLSGADAVKASCDEIVGLLAGLLRAIA